ncbi:MAG TPA: endonuclease III [Syntrophorhabdales bacterium]|nr:endonuclease III [Syntrophorhabdales bacterium]
MKKDVKGIFEKLKKMHGKPRAELNFSSPLELVVAAILAAQCTDERVNRVTESLFKKYRKPKDYTKVSDAELEEDVKPTGFFRNKARSLKNFADDIEKRFGGRVPEDVETLVTIKGIGRKTANMVAGLAFGKPAIIADTHLIRVSQRIGLTKEHEPDKIEIDLKRIVPQDWWTDFSLLITLHGRYICIARKPDCPRCLLQKECDFYQAAVKAGK